MREITPSDISKLADTIMPYLVFNRETNRYVLKEDAPLEIVEAQQAYQAWFYRSMMRKGRD